MVEFGAFRYDPKTRLLYRDNEEIALPPRVVAVLESLLKRPGEVVPKENILASVWRGVFVGDGSLAQAISVLRRTLGDDPQNPTYIQTLPKRGYRLLVEATEPRFADRKLIEQPTPGKASTDAGSERAPDHPRPRQDGPKAHPDRQPLAAGMRIGRYELIRAIDAGAMGDVWRARDTDLQRHVAIKVVSDHLTHDEEVMERFRREARILAGLEHPSIVGVHGIEEFGDRRFLVLELVEGGTLADRLSRGPLPLNEALDVALQIAEALEVAHSRGVIHRDLKPANVLLTQDGHIKLVDFGLAIDPRAGLESSVETSLGRSNDSALLGTSAYMSPESIRNEGADERTDVWAFGCVLYEMLTGLSPFVRDTTTETLAAVVEAEPDWKLVPKAVPESVRVLLQRCLRKNPHRRLHHVADARIEIEDALLAPIARTRHGRGEFRSSTRRGVLIALLFAGAAAIGAAANTLLRRLLEPPPSRTPLLRATFSMVLPEGHSTSAWGPFAVSPDGGRIVFTVYEPSGTRRLWLRDVADPEPRPIRGTERAANPFFSPDGSEIGFFATRDPIGIVIVSADGGIPRMILQDDDINHSGISGSWGADDWIVYGHDTKDLFAVHARQQVEPRRVTELDRSEEVAHYLPLHVPETPFLLYASIRGARVKRIERLNLDDGSRRVLIEDATNPRLIDSGHLLFQRRDDIYAIPFDRRRGEPIGEESWIASGVSSRWSLDEAQYAAAGTTAVWLDGDELPVERTLIRKQPPHLSDVDVSWTSSTFRSVRLHPDGEHFLVPETDSNELRGHIHYCSLKTPGPNPISTRGFPYAAIWHPGGGITYATHERDERRFVIYYIEAADVFGSTQHHVRLHAAVSGPFPLAWDPEGNCLLFAQHTPVVGWRLLYTDLSGSPPQAAATTPEVRGSQMSGDLSPDGRWIVYRGELGEAGESRIFVEPFPPRSDSGAVPLVSFDSGHPRWVPGPEGEDSVLYFVRYSSPSPEPGGGDLGPMLMQGGINSDGQFEQLREVLPLAGYVTSDFALSTYDVAADGTIYLLRQDRVPEPRTLHVKIGDFVDA